MNAIDAAALTKGAMATAKRGGRPVRLIVPVIAYMGIACQMLLKGGPTEPAASFAADEARRNSCFGRWVWRHISICLADD